jgi:hypothetical protein
VRFKQVMFRANIDVADVLYLLTNKCLAEKLYVINAHFTFYFPFAFRFLDLSTTGAHERVLIELVCIKVPQLTKLQHGVNYVAPLGEWYDVIDTW